MMDFFEDHPWMAVGLVVVAFIGLVALMSRSQTNRCNQIMSFARTPHDSMTARIACEQLNTEDSKAAAMAAGAGAIAGSTR